MSRISCLFIIGCLIVLGLGAGSVQAQSQEEIRETVSRLQDMSTDSLLTYAEKAAKQGEAAERIEAMLGLMQAYVQVEQGKPILALAKSQDWASATPDQELRFRTYVAWAYLQTANPDKSEQAFEQAQSLEGDPSVEAASKAFFYYHWADAATLRNIGNVDSRAAKGLKWAKESAEATLLARAWVQMAQLAMRQSDFEQALAYLNMVDSLSKLPANTFTLAHANALRAQAFNRQAVSDSAILAIEKAQTLAKQSQNPLAGLLAKVQLGDYYILQREFAQAKSYYQEVAVDQLARPWPGGYAVFTKLGGIYLATGRVDSAFWWFDQATLLASKFGDLDRQGTISLLKSELLQRMQQLPAAEASAQQAFGFFAQTGDTTKQLLARLGAGRIAFAQGRMREALTYIEGIFKITETYEWDSRAFPETYLLKARADSALGNYAAAYDAMAQYAVVADTFAVRTYRKEAAAQETRYQTAQKEAQIEVLQEKERTTRQRLYLTLAIVGILLLAGGIIVWLGRQVAQQRDELQAANATKDRLFGMLAHDLRGPVAGFQNMGRIFQHFIQKGQTAQLEKVGLQIDKQASQLRRLLDNLLAWSLQEQGLYTPQLESLDVSALAEEVMEFHQPNAEAKGLSLQTEIEAGLRIKADRRGILLALNNLLANAVKYTETGHISLEAHREAGKVQLIVADTGVGMSEARLQEVLKAQSLKSEAGTKGEKGTGLGLKLVRDLIKGSKGSMSLQTKEGIGTRVSIALEESKPNMVSY